MADTNIDNDNKEWVGQVRQSFRDKTWAYEAAMSPGWCSICPPKKKTVGDYCLKKIAFFAPHLQIKGYYPHCPRCRTPYKGTNYEFVERARIVHGMGDTTLLDGAKYPCGQCKTKFRAWDKESLAMDNTGQVRAFFKFHLTSFSTVTQDLYQYII